MSKKHQGFASTTRSEDRAWGSFSLTVPRRHPCQHLDFTLPGSRTANESNSVASSQPVCGILFQQPQEARTPPRIEKNFYLLIKSFLREAKCSLVPVSPEIRNGDFSMVNREAVRNENLLSCLD